MRFYIDNNHGDNYETFETEGHIQTTQSAHLDAMKIASSWGYSSEKEFYLATEDGQLLEVVDPYHSGYWLNVAAYEAGVMLERAA